MQRACGKPVDEIRLSGGHYVQPRLISFNLLILVPIDLPMIAAAVGMLLSGLRGCRKSMQPHCATVVFSEDENIPAAIVSAADDQPEAAAQQHSRSHRQLAMHSPLACGAAAVNAILQQPVASNHTLQRLHCQLGGHSDQWRNASAELLLQLLWQYGVTQQMDCFHRTVAGFTNTLGDACGGMLLLNNSQHWTALRRLNEHCWLLHDDQQQTGFSVTEAEQYLECFTSQVGHWAMALRRVKPGEQREAYAGPRISGRGCGNERTVLVRMEGKEGQQALVLRDGISNVEELRASVAVLFGMEATAVGATAVEQQLLEQFGIWELSTCSECGFRSITKSGEQQGKLVSHQDGESLPIIH